MKVSFLFLRREVLVDIQQPASIKKDTSEWRTPQCIYSLRKWKKKKKKRKIGARSCCGYTGLVHHQPQSWFSSREGR
jgi:hypothetical protein